MPPRALGFSLMPCFQNFLFMWFFLRVYSRLGFGRGVFVFIFVFHAVFQGPNAVADSLADLWESLGAKQQQGNHKNKEQVPRLKKTFTHKTSKPDALPAARRRQKYFASVLQLDLAKATPSHPG